MKQQEQVASDLACSEHESTCRSNLVFSLDSLEKIKKLELINQQKQLLTQINGHKDRSKSAVAVFNR